MPGEDELTAQVVHARRLGSSGGYERLLEEVHPNRRSGNVTGRLAVTHFGDPRHLQQQLLDLVKLHQSHHGQLIIHYRLTVRLAIRPERPLNSFRLVSWLAGKPAASAVCEHGRYGQ